MMRTRWTPAELSLIALGFFMPLGADVRPALLNDPRIPPVLAVISVYLCAASIVALRRSAHPLREPMPLMAKLLMAYSAVLVVATLGRHLSAQRYVLFALFLAALFCWWVVERLRPGAWLDIVYTIGVLHLGIALLLNERTVVASGASRLGGSTSPVLLAFEASMVLVVTLWQISGTRGLRRLWLVAVCLASCFVIFAAFSRAALIAVPAALLITWIYRSAGQYLIRAVAATVALVLVWSYGLTFAVRFLGGNDPASVYGASGRFVIWQRLLAADDARWRGYGFGALYDAGGPDNRIWTINQGLPTENALLQVFFMGGVIALVIWLVYAFAIGRLLWSSRQATRGLSLALLVLLVVDAIFSAAASGISYSWWWSLAAVSLALTDRARTGIGQDDSETAGDPTAVPVTAA